MSDKKNAGRFPSSLDTGAHSAKLPAFRRGQVIVKWKTSPTTATQGRTNSALKELQRRDLIKESSIPAFRRSVRVSARNHERRSARVGQKTRTPRLDGTEILKLSHENIDVLAVVNELRKNPEVEYAEPNYLAQTVVTPNDPKFADQWAHRNTEAEAGWALEQGHSNSVVAVIDTGVDHRHEDLADNIWKDPVTQAPGADFVDIDIDAYEKEDDAQRVPGEDYQGVDGDPTDYNGHGTHCAGIVAAKANNQVGIAGVCSGCKIMAVRAGFSIRYPSGSGGTFEEYGLFEYDDIANAIVYAVDQGADVISMSFGSNYDSSILRDAVDYARSKGVVLVAAAGNSNSSSKFYPAAYPGVVSVAATDEDNALARFSNFGFWVTVAAPGVDILSTIPKTGTMGDASGYTTLSGTSMAAPYVAGMAGLLLSQNPTRTTSQIETALVTGMKNLTSFSGTSPAGLGLVNVKAALQSSQSAQGSIHFPVNGSTMKEDSWSVIGTAVGFRYSLEFGEGAYPQTWNWVSGTEAKVSNPSSLGTVNLSGLPSGAYSLRLRVEDSAGAVIEKKVIVLRDALKPTVAQPIFSLDAGSYNVPQQVAVTTSTVGASIRYKTDGSNPSCSSGTVYTKPISLAQSLTLKAVACKAGWLDSRVETAVYTLAVGAPTFSVRAGSYSSPQQVSLASVTPNAGIRFTTNGVDPTCSTGTLFTTPISIASNTTLKAIGCRAGWSSSVVTSSAYTIVLVPEPIFSPAPGSYRERFLTVRFVNSKPGTSIFYTTNGQTPSCSRGTRYRGSFQVQLSASIRAVACDPSGRRSNVATGSFIRIR